MKYKIHAGWLLSVALVFSLAALRSVSAQRAKIGTLACNPYQSAMAIDAESGQILFAENPDAPAYPASVLKLMVLLIVLEKAQTGELRLQDQVPVTAEAARIGGSQVYLKEHESFTIDDMLYALMVQSANDAAMALAIHVAGSKEAFVALMNRRAAELGMKNTQFHSVHGLPPQTGQNPDSSTARDMARLARELLKHPDTLRYTATRERGFRNNTFIMRTHNPLLGRFDGCDGMKTGYFTAAGYSIVATARRDDARVIVVILGSSDKKIRNAKAAELLARGFGSMPKKAISAPVTLADQPVVAAQEPPETSGRKNRGIVLLLTGVLVVALALAGYYLHALKGKSVK